MFAIARLTLLERRRQLLWTVLGMIVLVGLVVGIWPSYRDAGVGSIYAELPESMQSMFGLTVGEFSGPVYVHAELMSFMVPLVLVGIAIAIGSAAATNESGAGRLDVLLASGITRHHLLLGRVLGIAVQLLAICIATGITLWAGGMVVDLGLESTHVAGAILLAWELGVLYGVLALAVASWTGRHGVAAGIAAGIATASWLMSSLGSVVESIEPVSGLLAFHRFTDGPPLVAGAEASNVLLLAAEVLALIAAALVGFTRRDVA